jgi:exonuclease III
MKILSWNCRGLGNPQLVRALTHLVRTKKPHLVFLIKTKMTKNKVEFIRIKLGYNRMFVVDCKGRNGGLLLLWNSDSHMEIQNFSRRHINSVFLNQNKEPIWKLTCLYGHPDVRKRVEAWNLLRHLS